MCCGSGQASPPPPPAATRASLGPAGDDRPEGGGEDGAPQPFIPPALREAGSPFFSSSPSAATLDRWRAAYGAMAAHARSLGVPASAIPALAPGAGRAEVVAAREALEGLLASFLSAGL